MPASRGARTAGGFGALDALYREVVMDHHRRPRGNHELLEKVVEAAGVNPTCGDEVCLQLDIRDGSVRDAGVQTKGCAISRASGSMLAEAIAGKPLGEVRRIADVFRRVMKGDEPPSDLDLGDLEALTGVRQFPVRIKCALLPWVTLLDAMLAHEEQRGAATSTTEAGEEDDGAPTGAREVA